MRVGRHAWHDLPGTEPLAQALAERVAERLAAAVAEKGAACLAVSGGTTPGRFFDALSRLQIRWDHVTVTLVDERFVPPSSQRSNERLVRGRLLKGAASAARFVGLWRNAATAEAAADWASEALAHFASPKHPPDVAVLGMGLDGHTASFFPGAGELARLLAPDATSSVLPVQAPGAGEPRLTLPLATLRRAGTPFLHIEGEPKRAVLLKALSEPADQAPPIRTVLDAVERPVQIFWAPGG